MVTLRVSKNILKRLMNIYIHQAAGVITPGAATCLPPFMLACYFRVRHLSIFIRRYGDETRARETRERGKEKNNLPSRVPEETRIPVGNNPTGDTNDYAHLLVS